MTSLFLISILLAIISPARQENFINKDWVQPGWGKRNNRLQNSPQETDEIAPQKEWENPGWGKRNRIPNNHDSITDSPNHPECKRDMQYEVLEFYYTKLANYLINSRNLKTDDNQNYVRFIEVKISKAQLEQFNSIVGNPAAMDAIIFDVISSSNDGFIFTTVTVLETIGEKFQLYFGNIFVSQDIKFVIYVTGSLLVIRFLSKKFNKHFFIVAIIAAFLVNYFVDYRRCGLEKQAKAFLELQEKTQNPCEFKTPTTYREKFLEYFNMGSKDECIKHLLKNTDKFASDEFCNVWEHFVDFMFYKTLGTFVEKMSEIFGKILSKNSFPYNIVIAVLFIYMLWDLLKDILKHFVTGMFGFGQTALFGSQTDHQRNNNTFQNHIQQPPPMQPIMLNFNIKSKSKSKTRNQKLEIEQIMGSKSTEIQVKRRIIDLPQSTDDDDETRSESSEFECLDIDKTKGNAIKNEKLIDQKKIDTIEDTNLMAEIKD